MAPLPHGMPLDYVVEREPIAHNVGACRQCHRSAAVTLVTVQRVTKRGDMVTESQGAYCGPCGAWAERQARELCRTRLYGWQGHDTGHQGPQEGPQQAKGA